MENGETRIVCKDCGTYICHIGITAQVLIYCNLCKAEIIINKISSDNNDLYTFKFSDKAKRKPRV